MTTPTVWCEITISANDLMTGKNTMALDLADSTVIPLVLGMAATMITAVLTWIGRILSETLKHVAVHNEKINNHGERLNNHGERIARVEDKTAEHDTHIALLRELPFKAAPGPPPHHPV